MKPLFDLILVLLVVLMVIQMVTVQFFRFIWMILKGIRLPKFRRQRQNGMEPNLQPSLAD